MTFEYSLTTITSTSLSNLCVFSAASGVVSHVTYFIRGEHHNQAYALFKLLLLAPTAFIVAQYVFTDTGLYESLTRGLVVTVSYLTALFTSMLVYRVLFHPLKRFPGPFAWKFSKFLHLRKAVNLKNYLDLDELHKQYGDFVRTGPNELTLFSPAAVMAVHGPRTKCTRGPWSDRTLPALSLQSVRDKGVHDRRRRIWDKGFNVTSLRAYEDRVVGHSKTLLHQFQARAGEVIDVTKWFHLFGFDVMTDIAFGRPYNMTQTGEMHFALEKLRLSMRYSHRLFPVSWLFIMLRNLPGASSNVKWFIQWCMEQMMERVKMDKDIEVRDVTSWLIEAYQKSDPANRGEELMWLMGDARLLIIAGSDTTSSTLTNAAYELALHPEHIKKLREELASVNEKSDGTFDMHDLQNLDHLNGIINEALRLHPPVIGGVYRETPPEGITIDGTFVPGNTSIIVPYYTVHRSERAFEMPDEFIPERWYSRPELIKDKTAFAPFSIGAYSCIGKQLALMELRIVLAMVVKNFDFKFAPGTNGSDFIENSLDTFTIAPAPLPLLFETVR